MSVLSILACLLVPVEVAEEVLFVSSLDYSSCRIVIERFDVSILADQLIHSV